MRNALALACVLAAAPAAAQPIDPGAPTCAVTIARAPDDVRLVIEQWVRAEPRCGTALEVRVVPTDGGLYLLARDEHGRVRERVVPDAQSAGVLVASWAAEAASPPGSPVPQAPVTPAPVTPAPVTPAPVAQPESLAAAPGATVPAVVTMASPAPRAPSRWLALGGMFAMSGSGGGGIRAELDVKVYRYATLGVAASASNWGTMYYGTSGTSTLETFDAKALAYLSVNATRGRWHFRAAVGGGMVYTRAMLDQPTSFREADGVFPAGEAAVSVGRELGSHWQAYGGPIVSVYAQSYQIDEMGPDYYSSTTAHRDLEAMFLVGMRRRL